MSSRLKKILLLLLAAVLLVGVAPVQNSLNRDRERLGMTRVDPLENAPPVLAFTTVALGGFRGLIANALWIRASELQDEDKFFEMVQLADWITKLEPHFVHVWVVQAWNMAFNISVKFKDPEDRWRWVQRGIELLRDEGLKYNPGEPLIYRELAWFFQFKMGANLDDANVHYKQQWANEMTRVFGTGRPNFDALIKPQTAEEMERARLLVEKYKVDPEFLRKVDERYGPLEWRLPESHAIYWAALGLEKIGNDPRGNKQELVTLRRVIFQSMQLAFIRGRLIANRFAGAFDYGPNVDIIRQANDAYLEMMEQDAEMREHFKTAHRNFLIRGVYFLYLYNRRGEAERWYKYLAEQYPGKPVLEYEPNSLPGTLTLDEFAVARVRSEVQETSRDNITAVLEGYLLNSFYNLAIDQGDQAYGYERLAQLVYNYYTDETKGSGIRVQLAPFAEIRKDVLNRVLDPETGYPPEAANVLRTEFGLPAATNAPPAATNTPAASPRGSG